MRTHTIPLDGRLGMLVRIAIVALALLALCAPGRVDGQRSTSLPFSIGERMTFRLNVGRMGSIGRGTMWVEGPVDVRGTDAMLLRFDIEAGVGFVKAVDRTSSWFDASWMRSLRFSKRERHPLSRHEEDVELFPAQNRWEEADGSEGAIATDLPLDELSFMYFLRTLPLTGDSTLSFARHFETERNPTTVRVVGRETLTTAAGTFQTVLIEMRVRDPRRYQGEGVIRINLTDDHCRIPVRIESSMPVLGRTVLSLESHAHGDVPCGDR